jgi:hypothetical protein
LKLSSIGGRNRIPTNSNFNTTNGGYDYYTPMPLGYPESHYANPWPRSFRRNIIQCISPLQYGKITNRGLVNSKSTQKKPLNLHLENTIGSTVCFTNFTLLAEQTKNLATTVLQLQTRVSALRPKLILKAKKLFCQLNQ